MNIYKDIAHAFCQSLEEYYEPSQSKYKKAQEEIENYSRTAKIEENNNKKGDDEDSDYSGDELEIENNGNGGNGNGGNNKKSVDAKEPRDTTGEKNLLIKKKIPMSLNKNSKKGGK